MQPQNTPYMQFSHIDNGNQPAKRFTIFGMPGFRCCLFLFCLGGSITIAPGEKHKPPSWSAGWGTTVTYNLRRSSGAQGHSLTFTAFLCSIWCRTVWSDREDGKQRESLIWDEGQEWKCSKKRWRCPRLYETLSAQGDVLNVWTSGIVQSRKVNMVTFILSDFGGNLLDFIMAEKQERSTVLPAGTELNLLERLTTANGKIVSNTYVLQTTAKEQRQIHEKLPILLTVCSYQGIGCHVLGL